MSHAVTDSPALIPSRRSAPQASSALSPWLQWFGKGVCALWLTASCSYGQGSPAPVAADLGTVPSLTAQNLNDKSLNLPADLSEGIWICIAFDQKQQSEVNRIFAFFDALKPSAPSLQWLEFPVVDNPGSVIRWATMKALKAKITSSPWRDRVVPLFVDLKAWKSSMKITDGEVYLVRTGASGALSIKVKSSTVKSAADLKSLIATAK